MFDVNNQYTGTYFGKDRLGFTTPDAEGTEILRPFLTVPYPAPWLPGRRRDEGHPVGAAVVLSSQYAVGQDKSGALVPAGMRSGSTGAGGPSCVIKYGPDDVGMSYNPRTGNLVAAAGEAVLIACADDAVAPLVIGTDTFDAPAVAFAKTCNLIPGGVARPVGYAVRNVFQYLGGVDFTAKGDAAKGIKYKLNGVIPVKFRIHNYMHEPGTAVQTSFGLRVPYIGETPTTLDTLAAGLGLDASHYTLDDFSRSFVHCVGKLDDAPGALFAGAAVVADDQNGGLGAGHFRPYDSTKHASDQIIGRVLGIEQIYPIRDYADRVRTQFDRAQGFVGPFADSHPTTMQMGGSATRGMDYAINLATKGLLRKLLDAGVTPANIPVEAGTYVWIGFRSI